MPVLEFMRAYVGAVNELEYNASLCSELADILGELRIALPELSSDDLNLRLNETYDTP